MYARLQGAQISKPFSDWLEHPNIVSNLLVLGLKAEYC